MNSSNICRQDRDTWWEGWDKHKHGGVGGNGQKSLRKVVEVDEESSPEGILSGAPHTHFKAMPFVSVHQEG